MRRTFDDRADSALQAPEMGDPGDRLLPCAFCGNATKHKVLATLGARCAKCFRRYCESAPPAPDSGDKRIGPKSWAYRLKAREQAGERLSPVQRRFWREALRHEAEVSA